MWITRAAPDITGHWDNVVIAATISTLRLIGVFQPFILFSSETANHGACSSSVRKCRRRNNKNGYSGGLWRKLKRFFFRVQPHRVSILHSTERVSLKINKHRLGGFPHPHLSLGPRISILDICGGWMLKPSSLH